MYDTGKSIDEASQSKQALILVCNTCIQKA